MSVATRPPSRAAARKLVNSILERLGRPPQDVWESIKGKLTEAECQALEFSYATKDRLIGSSVITLAQNLYDSKARFIFELLQNAEDNDYGQAILHGEVPKVTFSIYPNHVVLECNEDGFNEVNLRSICAIGESSKTRVEQGYIGQKGIGFKSVFMAADRVHIQSGHLCFQFSHRPGDSGMGMITPLWEESLPSTGERCTRITLDLRETGSPADAMQRNREIHQQLNDIHDAILIFLKKIQKLEILFFDQECGEGGEPFKTITHSIERTGAGAICKKHTQAVGQGAETAIRHYHITEHIATGLAKAQGRTYSESEEASRAYSRGEVILAFPLTAESVPVLENQWVFAFLPVRQMGFKFLVHADFDTQANRQGIVTSSARNEGLAAGIADAFANAVVELCGHPTLRFRWMRYLPEQNAYPWDSFWKGVIDKIKDRLAVKEVLVPARSVALRRIRDLQNLRNDAITRDGQPLLPDTYPEKYISTQYDKSDLTRLDDFGLDYMAMDNLIARARADLASGNSRMKTSLDSDWHTRVADLLHRPFRQGWSVRISEVKALDLIPLKTGQWTSTNAGPVYYDILEGTGLMIPSALNMRVVDPTAVANGSRKRLFDAVGVQTASVSSVQNSVATKCGDPGLGLSESVECLRFLYLTQRFGRPNVPAPLIYDHHCVVRNGRNVDVYTRTNHPYDAAQLFYATVSGPAPGSGAPGFNVLFVNDAYFTESPSLPAAGPAERQTVIITRWADWLAAFCSLTTSVSIYDIHRSELTPFGSYIAQHRPDKFVGLLQKNWTEGLGSKAQQDGRIIDTISQIPVLCQGAGVTLRPLKSTYLPFPELVAISSRFMADGEFFPWLKLEISLEDPEAAGVEEWRALGSAFGRQHGGHSILEVALAVLKYIVDANPIEPERPLPRPDRMPKLYTYLQSRIGEATHPDECRQIIRTAFTDEDYIYVPETSKESEYFATVGGCLWSAPLNLGCVGVLQACYVEAFSLTADQLLSLQAFFVHTLGIRASCGWKDLVDEIRYIRNGLSHQEVTDLYKCLRDMRLTANDTKELKQAFLKKPLILSSLDKKWSKSSDCLWSSATEISGKVVLDHLYPGLQDFFVNLLGVPKMTAGMVYDKLKARHDETFTSREAKETIMVFNSFLAAVSAPTDFPPNPVRENQIFPVRFPDGQVRLCNGLNAFSLKDRKILGETFARLANFLDFDLQELRRLEPFITWAGLGDRYLSTSVKEITSADRESTQPMSNPYREIRRKSHALLRIATFFGSPRTQSSPNDLYSLLRNSATLETDQITAELLLTQGDQVHRVEKDSVLVHIRESDDNRLTIYVPRDERSQEVCFNSKLPRSLCEWLMTDPVTQIAEPMLPHAVNAVQSVLNAKPFALDDILNEHGIGEISIANVDDAYNAREPGSTTEIVPVRPGASLVGSETSEESVIRPPDTPPRRPTPPHDWLSIDEDEDSFIMATPLSSVASPTHGLGNIAAQSQYAPARPLLRLMPQVYRNPTETDRDTYARLLQKIVRAARSSDFPSKGPFNMADMRAALPGTPDQDDDDSGETYRIRSSSQIERDKQIGAAGELFVFELLSHLLTPLPGFSMANWQSTIRHYVSSHSEYSDIRPWVGTETADIVYDDTTGEFTRLLVDKGYLDSEYGPWEGATPRYYVEVKATTKECNTRFFMSKGQYRRMQENTNGTGNRESVYVIFRVYGLESGEVGLKVLVDPEGMMVRGELEFTVESWSVVTAG